MDMNCLLKGEEGVPWTKPWFPFVSETKFQAVIVKFSYADTMEELIFRNGKRASIDI